MRVFVYRNLHKKCFSVRNVETGLVIRHAETVLLADATFKVSEAGRQRVLRQKMKNVHAGVQGTLVDGDSPKRRRKFNRARYNPYTAGFFADEEGNPVTAAKTVLLMDGKIWFR